jgi:AraC-like DNA-binding protein
VASRQRIDWPVILGPSEVGANWRDDLAPSDWVALVQAFEVMLATDDTDALLKGVVTSAIEVVGLERAGVYLYDGSNDMMLGTWGTDLDRNVVDEHHAMFEAGAANRRVFERAERGEAHWTVVENCPIIDQREHQTHICGRGWVVCTPIRSTRGAIGMLYNDAGLSGKAVEAGKQLRTVVLCSLVAALLDTPRHAARVAQILHGTDMHPAVRRVVQLLSRDPTLGGKELASQCGMSLSRLVRVFKAGMGTSLVDYRNRLRLERFLMAVDGGGNNLLEAALSSGFGSYAQFHRVFRAAYRRTPREFLQARSG